MDMTMDTPSPLAEPAFERVGRIVAISGGRAVVMLDEDSDASSSHKRTPEIGTLLKVELDRTIALALVSGLSQPMPDESETTNTVRIAEVEFIGELVRGADGSLEAFRRGVSQYPGLGDVVARASREELKKAYACDGEASIKVGVIHQDPSIPATVKIDEMLGKHFAILGTTGTGKSCSVALIMRRIAFSRRIRMRTSCCWTCTGNMPPPFATWRRSSRRRA